MRRNVAIRELSLFCRKGVKVFAAFSCEGEVKGFAKRYCKCFMNAFRRGREDAAKIFFTQARSHRRTYLK